MSEEIWKVVRDAPNYEVSNLGNVRRRKSQRALKPQGTAQFPRVVLMSYGERLSVLIKDVVAAAFGEAKSRYIGELWRTVDCAWAYEVSDQGRVRNRRTGRILKPYPNNRTGRPQVTLVDEGYRITRPVARLVEEAFG